jgi:hypothetical protein
MLYSSIKMNFLMEKICQIKSITMAGLFEGQLSSSEDEGSNEPQSFLFENNRVYLANDLMVFDRPFFVGCIGKIRSIPTKKNIPENLFWYATYSDKTEKWKESTKENKRAKLLIHQDWVRSNLPKFTGDQTKYKYKPLPPLVILSEEEKFRDGDGNIYEVEVRGTRSKDGIRFKLKDIQRVFEMEDLDHHIARMVDKEEYEIFLSSSPTKKVETVGLLDKNIGGKSTAIFISYNGLLKVIFSARSGTAYRFQDWVGRVIYTAHLGTDEERFDLALDMVGVNANIVKKVFDTCVTKVPCIYLFRIGLIKDMRKFYPELKEFTSGILYKFGMTDSLHRRLIEHIKDYGSLNGSTFKLVLWSPINQKCISRAETDLSHFLDDAKVPFLGHDEIVGLTREDMVGVKAKFTDIYNTFGIVTEMAKIMTKNDKLVESQRYQKILLKEKDSRIAELNREISSYIDQLKQSKVQLKQANIREVSQTNTLKQHKKRKNLRQKERLRFARRFEKLSEEVKAEVTLLFRNLSLLETTPPTTDDSE